MLQGSSMVRSVTRFAMMMQRNLFKLLSTALSALPIGTSRYTIAVQCKAASPGPLRPLKACAYLFLVHSRSLRFSLVLDLVVCFPFALSFERQRILDLYHQENSNVTGLICCCPRTILLRVQKSLLCKMFDFKATSAMRAGMSQVRQVSQLP